MADDNVGGMTPEASLASLPTALSALATMELAFSDAVDPDWEIVNHSRGTCSAPLHRPTAPDAWWMSIPKGAVARGSLLFIPGQQTSLLLVTSLLLRDHQSLTMNQAVSLQSSRRI